MWSRYAKLLFKCCRAMSYQFIINEQHLHELIDLQSIFSHKVYFKFLERFHKNEPLTKNVRQKSERGIADKVGQGREELKFYGRTSQRKFQ